jgi:hypothetical protein
VLRNCGSPEAKENLDLRDQQCVLQAQLDSALKHTKEVMATVQVQEQKILQLCVARCKLRHDANRLHM